MVEGFEVGDNANDRICNQRNGSQEEENNSRYPVYTPGYQYLCHGGANEQVMMMLTEIGDPAKAESYVLDALSRKERIPGFGHAVYRTEDPRAAVLRGHAERLSEQTGDMRWFEIAKEVERVTLANTKVHPNVDFYSGIAYHLMGIPMELFTPLFACSRVVGWTAHILEQWSDNRLIRPRANYTGPVNLRYVPIRDRTS